MEAGQDARRRAKAGLPPAFDSEVYKQRHAAECAIVRYEATLHITASRPKMNPHRVRSARALPGDRIEHIQG
ncbi:hypothetical protein [Sphaerisporangium aureirubrum]|uniref:Uncharacterized protein n=1 Tax=Sphaerisporangium aureirubrum TaxID=1544736 RepID=A0ABW1NUY6_9ACTN